ncbi:MAG: hypothetical protein Q9207_006321, partial [Kuettlingeria erythrocarpa]
LPASPPFSHVVVFLVPGPVLLPADTLAAVYIQLPPSPSRDRHLRPEDAAAAAGFQLLGAIGNEKQSAVFRVNNHSGNGNGHGNAAAETGGLGDMGDEMSDATTTMMATDGVGGGVDGVQQQQQQVTIGISVEPAAAVQAQLAALRSSSSSSSLSSSSALVRANQQRPSPVSTKVLAQRIIKNAFNFLASFAGQTTVGGEEMVPLRSFRAWWEKFERRVENDPGFLEREGDG